MIQWIHIDAISGKPEGNVNLHDCIYSWHLLISVQLQSSYLSSLSDWLLWASCPPCHASSFTAQKKISDPHPPSPRWCNISHVSNYVINGLLKVQANHRRGEPLTLSANLCGLEKRDLYQSGRTDAWLGAADRESGPLIRTPSPFLTDRLVFALPSVLPRSAGTSRSTDMRRETTSIQRLVFINWLVQTKHNQTPKLRCTI